MAIILGLDVGDVRIGIAISDELGIAAHPLCTIRRKNSKADLEALQGLIGTHKAEGLVVGLPKMLTGEIGIQGQKVQQFVEELKQQIDLPVTFWDERFTTVEAERMLRGTKKRGRKRKEVVDQVAAVLILNAYLDRVR